ncbi:MAG: hypothetical protein VW683_00500 [Betaproteobacteria bacterium]|jgi:hypothetical protein
MAQFTNKLLQEAIADAEALHESALVTAKLALEESFTPKIKEAIANRLRNEADSDEWYMGDGPEPLDEAEEEEEEKEMEEAADPHPATKADSFGKVEEDVAAEMSSSPTGLTSSGVGASGDSGIEGSPSVPAAKLDSSKVGNDGESSGLDRGAAKGGDGDEWYMGSGKDPMDEDIDVDGEYLEESLDLESIIRELQRDVDALAQLEAGAAPEMDDDEPLDLEPKPDAAPEAPPEAAMGRDDEEDPFGDRDEDIDLEEILREIEAEAEIAETAEVATENARLKEELSEAMEAVKILKTKLDEVNLLNAKLNHTTRLFRAGLSEDQKVRIVEQFDRATTIREVKLLYAALAESIVDSRKSSRKTAPSRQVVAEGVASSVKAGSQVITEHVTPSDDSIVSSDAIRRLQELAGIKR